VSGEVLIEFSLADTSNPAATPQELTQRFRAIAVPSPAAEEEEDEAFLRMDSGDADDQEDQEDQEEEEEASDEIQDESKKAEVREKRRKKLRMAKLKKKVKERAYEFSDKSEVAGVLFLEIVKITDLPPERNGMSCAVPTFAPQLTTY
jgi:phosphatidylserine decarboxylase